MSVVKNTMYYSLALVYQKILGFIYFALIARGLGVENTGQYIFALSLTSVFAVLADMGFAPVLIREIAKDKSRVQALFAQVFSIKLLISFITYIFVVLFVNILDYPSLTKILVYIAGIVMIFDSFSLVNWAVFRGYKNLKYESIGVIWFQTITVGLGLLFIYLGLGLIPLLLATLAGSLFFLIFSFLLLFKKLNIKLQVIFKKSSIKWFVISALPFALAGAFARIYTQIDTIMLSKIGCFGVEAICSDNVGWYGVASKITLALQFIPLALSAALFPVFSEQHTHSPEKLKTTYEQAWRYLAILVVPISAGIITLAPELIGIVWGSDFLPAVLPLQILMGSLVFLFLTFPNGALLNASGKQLVNTSFMGVAVVINILLNVYLIINYQMTGAAIASISSTFILFILGFVKTYFMIRFKVWRMLFNFFRIVIVGLMMILFISFIKSGLPLMVVVVMAMVFYFIVLLILGGFSKEDVVILKRFLPS